MRTPRPIGTRRGIGTLVGNGWLHEHPKNLWPHGWDVRGRSALQKCMYMPTPPGVKLLAPGPLSPVAMAPTRKHEEQPLVAHRHDPAKDVRLFPAVSPADAYDAKRQGLHASDRSAKARPTPAWFEDPVALGALLMVLPPIGLAALWTSKRYSSDARWALTVMTALTLSLGAAIVILALRS